MDISTIITATISSGIVSVAAARWLTQRLVEHRFAKDLKNHQAALDEKLASAKTEFDIRLATAKAEVEAALRKGVEEYLGDQAADRQYRLDARKRLYSAIGPLRFQLVRACSDYAARIDRIGSGKQTFQTSLSGYFGRSTAFRLLRLFAIAELIERQMTHADFSVEPSMEKLLRFKQEAFFCLSSSRISLKHPNANWGKEVEHVLYDKLSIVASAMIVSEGIEKQTRVMRFGEFCDFVEDSSKLYMLAPIPDLMEGFAIDTKPIFWIRLVALGQLCSAFAAVEGPALGVPLESFDGKAMLLASKDKHLNEHRDEYLEMLKTVADSVKPTQLNPAKV